MVDSADRLTRYPVRINAVSRRFIESVKGAKPVTVTGIIEEEEGRPIVTPLRIELQPVPIEPSSRPAENTAEHAGAAELLKRWLAAVDANDLAAYQQCLHTETRKVNEYGTAEAMAFWTKQITDLYIG